MIFSYICIEIKLQTYTNEKKLAFVHQEFSQLIDNNCIYVDKAKENRKVLKAFYSILKDADKYIRFFFITGVSKFSQVSIFSELYNKVLQKHIKMFSLILCRKLKSGITVILGTALHESTIRFH